MSSLWWQRSQKAGREYTNIKYSAEAAGGGDIQPAHVKTPVTPVRPGRKDRGDAR